MREERDDCVWCHQERLAVRLRGPQRLHGDPRGCARFILDDDGLAETALQLLAHKARSDIDGTPGWKSDQDLDRPILRVAEWSVHEPPSQRQHGQGNETPDMQHEDHSDLMI